MDSLCLEQPPSSNPESCPRSPQPLESCRCNDFRNQLQETAQYACLGHHEPPFTYPCYPVSANYQSIATMCTDNPSWEPCILNLPEAISANDTSEPTELPTFPPTASTPEPTTTTTEEPTPQWVCEYGFYWETYLRHSCYSNFPDIGQQSIPACTEYCANDPTCRAIEHQSGGQGCEIVRNNKCEGVRGPSKYTVKIKRDPCESARYTDDLNQIVVTVPSVPTVNPTDSCWAYYGSERESCASRNESIAQYSNYSTVEACASACNSAKGCEFFTFFDVANPRCRLIATCGRWFTTQTPNSRTYQRVDCAFDACSTYLSPDSAALLEGAQCLPQTSDFVGYRILLSRESTIRPGDVINVKSPRFSLRVLEPSSYTGLNLAIDTESVISSCTSLTAVAGAPNAGIQAAYVYSVFDTNTRESLANGSDPFVTVLRRQMGPGITNVSVRFAVTNALGNSQMDTVIVERTRLSPPTVTFSGLKHSPVSEAYQITSNVQVPTCVNTDQITYNWTSEEEPIDQTASRLVIPVSSRIAGPHVVSLAVTFENRITTRTFRYTTFTPPIEVEISGGNRRAVAQDSIFSLTALVTDPMQAPLTSVVWSNDCNWPQTSKGTSCQFDNSGTPAGRSCVVSVEVESDAAARGQMRTATDNITVKVESNTLFVSIVSNLRRSPRKFLAYASSGSTYLWSLHTEGGVEVNLPVADRARLVVEDSQLTPGVTYTLQLVVKQFGRTGVAESTFSTPLTSEFTLGVSPAAGRALETPFSASVASFGCINCLYQFALRNSETAESWVFSDQETITLMSDLYFPAGNYDFVVTQTDLNGDTKDRSVPISISETDQDICALWSFMQTTLQSFMFVWFKLQPSDPCFAEVLDRTMSKLTSEAVSCAGNNRLLVDTCVVVLRHTDNLPTSYFNALLTLLSSAVECYAVTENSQLASKLTDGSLVSAGEISATYDALSEAARHFTRDSCDLLDVYESALAKLGLSSLFYDLPGGTQKRELTNLRVINERQTSELNAAFGDVSMNVPEAVAGRGRAAFRNILDAYDSVDFTAVQLPEDVLGMCRPSSGRQAFNANVDLFVDTSNSSDVLFEYRVRSMGAGAKCLFWDPARREWSGAGLAHRREGGEDVCAATHFTTFAVMYDDVDEAHSPVLWSIVGIFQFFTILVVLFQFRRLARADAVSYFGQTPQAVATVSHTLIGVIASLDLVFSICLLAGITHPSMYLLRIVPFCLTVLLYSLIAQQWIHIARGALTTEAAGDQVVVASNIFVCLLSLTLFLCALYEVDLEYFGVIACVFISLATGVIWIIFIVTGVKVYRRIQKMAAETSTPLTSTLLRRLMISTLGIALSFGALCVLNAIAGADTDWFEEKYAMIQGLYMGARLLTLWLVLYLHGQIIMQLDSPDFEFSGINPYACIGLSCRCERDMDNVILNLPSKVDLVTPVDPMASAPQEYKTTSEVGEGSSKKRSFPGEGSPEMPGSESLSIGKKRNLFRDKSSSEWTDEAAEQHIGEIKSQIRRLSRPAAPNSEGVTVEISAPSEGQIQEGESTLPDGERVAVSESDLSSYEPLWYSNFGTNRSGTASIRSESQI